MPFYRRRRNKTLMLCERTGGPWTTSVRAVGSRMSRATRLGSGGCGGMLEFVVADGGRVRHSGPRRMAAPVTRLKQARRGAEDALTSKMVGCHLGRPFVVPDSGQVLRVVRRPPRAGLALLASPGGSVLRYTHAPLIHRHTRILSGASSPGAAAHYERGRVNQRHACETSRPGPCRGLLNCSLKARHRDDVQPAQPHLFGFHGLRGEWRCSRTVHLMQTTGRECGSSAACPAPFGSASVPRPSGHICVHATRADNLARRPVVSPTGHRRKWRVPALSGRCGAPVAF